MNQIGFDNDKYLRTQSEKIRERIDYFGGKLYLEFGGKLFDDFHASRVLPGFAPDSKIRMLMQLKDQAEMIIVINASDIEKNKVRGDSGITYDLEVLRLIDAFRELGLFVGSIVLTRYAEHPGLVTFENKLRDLGLRVYRHYAIPGYPNDIATIVSDEGYGKNEYIETTRSLVVVTAPGPGSGKMATCLSNIYHDHKRGIRAGYAKFETFPIWNLALNHPTNVAYEAATADLNDMNMIDPFHLDAYGVTTVNYNRDVEIYPVLRAMFEKILGECPYKSPTDMGVNMAGNCIFDDDAVRRASKQEILRRYYAALCKRRRDMGSDSEVNRLKLLMQQVGVTVADRPCVGAAVARADETRQPAVSIELPDGSLVTGKTTPLLGASSACLLNALKKLAGVPKEIKLISPEILEPIQKLKINHLGNHNPRLHTNEVLIALSICATTDSHAARCMEKISELRGCEVHSSVLLAAVDENVFRHLGCNLTCEPVYQTKKLYHKN
ncbi:MAG: DUF1846 domain-containing protein [Clostridia bacterium]|nr:DUF1846 domain-containing protein [Clostridia bacterium]